MAQTILFAWELGGGLGHLSPAIPLFRRLRDMGYRVVLAARDLSKARVLAGNHGVELLQAPIKTTKTGTGSTVCDRSRTSSTTAGLQISTSLRHWPRRGITCLSMSLLTLYSAITPPLPCWSLMHVPRHAPRSARGSVARPTFTQCPISGPGCRMRNGRFAKTRTG